LNINVGGRRKAGRIGDQLGDLFSIHWAAGGDQVAQCIDHCLLAFFRCKLQYLYIPLVGFLFRMRLAKSVVGDAKLCRRKHLFAVLVVCKRSRFADQRIDDVTVVD
jgi:hypothetical protein